LSLASGQNYPDALGAGGSIAAVHGNLLPLDGKTIPPALVSLLGRLHPSKISVLGSAALLTEPYVAAVEAGLGTPGP